MGADGEHLAGGHVEKVRADAGVDPFAPQPSGGHQVNGHHPLEQGDIGMLVHRADQLENDLMSGDVPGMEHPPERMTSLPAQIVLDRFVAAPLEMDAQFFQIRNPRRSGLDNRLHRLLITQPGSGGEGVLDMRGEAVVVIHHTGNTSLCPVTAGNRGTALTGHNHPGLLRHRKGGFQTGDSRSHDQDGRLQSAHHVVLPGTDVRAGLLRSGGDGLNSPRLPPHLRRHHQKIPLHPHRPLQLWDRWDPDSLPRSHQSCAAAHR